MAWCSKEFEWGQKAWGDGCAYPPASAHLCFHLIQIHRRFIEMLNPLNPHEPGASGCGACLVLGRGACSICGRTHSSTGTLISRTRASADLQRTSASGQLERARGRRGRRGRAGREGKGGRLGRTSSSLQRSTETHRPHGDPKCATGGNRICIVGAADR